MKKPLTGLTPAAERLLFNARWDGNVRELKNAIERACILAEGATISERELDGAFGLAAALDQPSADVGERRARQNDGPAPLETL